MGPSLMPEDVVATLPGVSAFHHVFESPNNISQSVPLLRKPPSLSQWLYTLHRHL